VAIVVVLFAVSDGEPRLDPAGLEELARLGVTSVALLRDSSTAGVVLEGWAFDPRDTRRAVRAVAGTRERVRTLRPLVQMAVSSTVVDGDGDGKER
jgi:hypothetical protein